ncbi:MAG: type IV pilin protein [Stenotrophomonas sp.]
MAMRTQMKRIGRSQKSGGFTLIELMIVVAVVAILASIAYPSYADSVRKGKRGQAKADLMELAQLAERHRTVNNTYAGFSLPFTQTPREGGSASYAITLEEATVDKVLLKAAAKGAQAKDKCGDLTINQAGVKAASGGSNTDCW